MKLSDVQLTALSYRLLEASSIPDLLEIQEETFAYAKGDTDFLRRNTPETFAVCFAGESKVIGVYLEEKMIAFGILHAAGASEENLAKDADCIGDKLTSANVKLIIVRPDYRGNGIQRLLIDRCEAYAKESGFAWLCATVAPSNHYSLDNFLKCGFSQHKILRKYGGLERVLLVKKI